MQSVQIRVLALLKNNNDNALSLSFKIGNEIMQYYIINNDIALIMHYRALLQIPGVYYIVIVLIRRICCGNSQTVILLMSHKKC